MFSFFDKIWVVLVLISCYNDTIQGNVRTTAHRDMHHTIIDPLEQWLCRYTAVTVNYGGSLDLSQLFGTDHHGSTPWSLDCLLPADAPPL